MRNYVQRLLRSAGFAVELAVDGERALAAAKAHPANLILSDVMMPKLDGFGLLAALRNDPRPSRYARAAAVGARGRRGQDRGPFRRRRRLSRQALQRARIARPRARQSRHGGDQTRIAARGKRTAPSGANGPGARRGHSGEHQRRIYRPRRGLALHLRQRFRRASAGSIRRRSCSAKSTGTNTRRAPIRRSERTTARR